MVSVGGTANTGSGSVLGNVGDYFSSGLSAVTDAYKTWVNADLAKTQAKATAGYVPYGAIPLTPATAYTSTTGPFAGVDMRLMLLIAGAAVVALVMLRK